MVVTSLFDFRGASWDRTNHLRKLYTLHRPTPHSHIYPTKIPPKTQMLSICCLKKIMSCVFYAQLIDLQMFLGCEFASELMPREARVVGGLVGTGLDWCAWIGRFVPLDWGVFGMYWIGVLSICCLGRLKTKLFFKTAFFTTFTAFLIQRNCLNHAGNIQNLPTQRPQQGGASPCYLSRHLATLVKEVQPTPRLLPRSMGRVGLPLSQVLPKLE